MASSAIPPNPTSANVAHLLPKLSDADPDFRYMSLNDLAQMLNIGHSTFMLHDYNTCARTVDGLLATLGDTHGEVQNMAIKCLGPFVNKVPETILCPMIEKVSLLQSNADIDNTVPALALREIVVNLPRPIPGISPPKQVLDAYQAISRAMIPRLVGFIVIQHGRKDLPSPPEGMIASDIKNGIDSNAIDVLTEVARCFGPMLKEVEITALQETAVQIIETERASSVLKKKAVVAISTLATLFSEPLLSSFISGLIEGFRDPHLLLSKRKMYISILGSLSRSVPWKFGPHLKTLVPFVLGSLTQDEDAMDATDEEDTRNDEADEVREAALVALESFLAFCAQDMSMFYGDCVDTASTLLKYDPNLASGDDESMDGMDALDDEDEDFEEEDGFDDEDDGSWKIRRSAAKVLSTLISTKATSGHLLDTAKREKIAPVLLSRLKEREEGVRLEIIGALSTYVRNTSDTTSGMATSARQDFTTTSMAPPARTRKRRRGGSDSSMFEAHSVLSMSDGYTAPPKTSSPTSSQASLLQLTPDLLQALTPLLKNGSPATKQASMILLRDLFIALQGGLSDFLDQIFGSLIESTKAQSTHVASSSSVSAVSGNNLRISALQLVAAIIELHPTAAILPHLDQILPAVQSATRDRQSKVSDEALVVVEQLVIALTPPRADTSSSQIYSYLDQLYDVLASKTSDRDVDIEVRQRAIHVLGILLGRTSSMSGPFSSKYSTGLDLLSERLTNELTRLSAVKAIETVVILTKSKDNFSKKWVQKVGLELASQLRKSSRSLRGSSLAALRALAINPATRSHLDTKTVKQITQLLLPLIDSQDLHLLTPALIILATFGKEYGAVVLTDDLISSLCNLAKSSISGSSEIALLSLVQAIGEMKAGQSLMQNLLMLGIGGNSDLVGKLVGTLLVYGGDQVGVKLQDIVKELDYPDDKKRSLAVTVLGEVGIRMGSSSPLKPEQFMKCFSAKSDKLPLAAAVALGRAGSANIKVYLPVILASMSKRDSPQYLLLHSIKEILQHSGAETDIIPFANDLWQNIVAASQNEDNKAIGAECIGRLAIIDPKTFLPQLETFLKDKKASIRGMVISALRYALADTDDSYDEYLRPNVASMLTKMLNDPDIENRRLAMSTFNSAMHNKPELVMPALHELASLVLKETTIKPELIREVQMGPFKHKVDDGLEIRKSAYETLYSLLETTPLTQLQSNELFDRVVAGIADDHDVRTLCNLMLTKLLVLAPGAAVLPRLEDITQKFRAVLATKPKDNAVKQEIERLADDSKSVLKVSLAVSKTFPDALSNGAAGGAAGAHQGAAAASGAGQTSGGGRDEQGLRAWTDYWDWIMREFGSQVKRIEDESRDKDP